MNAREAKNIVKRIYTAIGEEAYDYYNEMGHSAEECMREAILANFPELSHQEFQRLLGLD